MALSTVLAATPPLRLAAGNLPQGSADAAASPRAAAATGGADAVGRTPAVARAGPGQSVPRAPDGLNDVQRARIAELAARDRQVRAHERAHVEAGRPWTGAPVYGFELGPDGRRYAVSGSVAIDLAPIDGDPEATAEKMRVVARAALAPAEPSPQDRKVAALARMELSRALAELAASAAQARESALSVRI